MKHFRHFFQDIFALQQIIRNSIFAVLFLLVADPMAMAKEFPWNSTPQAKLRVVAGGVATLQGEKPAQWLGLEFEAAPGWKLYWRTPGDAGFPPTLTWDAPENITDAEIMWPVPERHIESSDNIKLQSFIYHGKFILPLKITPEDIAKPLQGKLDVQYATCKDICIPLDATFDIAVSPQGNDSIQLAGIKAALDKVPAANGSNGMTILETHYRSSQEVKPYLEILAKTPEGFSQDADILVETDAQLQFDKPEVEVLDGQRACFHIPIIPLMEGAALSETDNLRLTLINRGKAIETTVGHLKAEPESVEQASPKGWLAILGFALVGGLILNVMPCVLPVLSIKILSVLKHGGKDRGLVRASFLASAAGIIVSFLIIGGITVVLKAGGSAVGWGFHFQDPAFLIALVLILVIFANNMAGRIEIRLPGWLSDSVVTMTPHHHSLIGDFMTGVLATVLATPCTAPFVGTAVSFALSQGPVQIFGVFTAMGVGLALPYLLFSIFPQLATKLPKPGIWMQHVKYFFAVLLGLTAFWLLWVLMDTLGIQSAVVVFLSALLVKFFVERRYRVLKHPLVWVPLLGMSLVVAFTIPLKVAERDMARQEMVAQVWQPFDEQKIPSLVAAGQVVFVDVTADWCITCKFNKFLVLDRADVMERFEEQGVIAMRADITKPNKVAMDFMKRHGRYGIPFNIVYGPGAPEGLPLSELLTVPDVFAALKKASGG